MDFNEFKTEVEDNARLYLEDYTSDYEIEFNEDPDGYHTAEVKVRFQSHPMATGPVEFTINVGVDTEATEGIGIQVHEDTYIPFLGEGIYTTLFFETLERMKRIHRAGYDYASVSQFDLDRMVQGEEF